MDADVLKAMFDASEQQPGKDSKFTPEEANRFKKAFEDPEFRRMFSEYMDELQDPKHREETEAYITQLEGEQKIPDGKELIRPQPGFVAKTYKIKENGKDVKEKIFINVVQCDKIAKPSKTSTPKGDCWSVPYSAGPPHMEKDKKGENSACFDCCFHPDALVLSEANPEFKNLLVTTAMDGVEALYKRQEQDVKLDRQFHVVKGISYKEGVVPTMMIAVANKDAWKDKSTPATKKSAPNSSSAAQAKATADGGRLAAPPAPVSPDKSGNPEKAKKSSSSPAIKKGFLNSAKTSLYPEKIPTIRPKTASQESPKELTEEEKKQQVDDLIKEMEKVSLQSQEPSQISTRDPKEQVSSDAMKAVSTKIKIKTSEETTMSSSGGPAVPLVVCKHREASSMGDFEAMKAQHAVSRRPTELVYEINLPLVTTPSKIILDVSEKKLVLSYTDVYKLDMELPFKVHDKKGKAAYDKAKKVLKVTLPVEQNEPMPVAPISAPSVVVQDDSPSKIKSSIDKVLPPVRSFSTSSTTHQTVEKHSRWVKSSVESNSPKKKVTEVGSSSTVMEESGNREEEELSESKKLFMEVQRQAEVAKQRYIEEQQSQNKPATAVPSKPKTETPRDTHIKSFILASSFQGAKKGYVFKRGDEGLGYYLDSKQSASSSISNTSEKQVNAAENSPETSSTPTIQKDSPSIPTKSPITFLAIPFDVKLNQDALSLLFQVKHIIPESVKIEVNKYSISSQFEAFSSPNGDGKKVYGMKFSLDEATCVGGLSNTKFKHDVASKNMVLVICKENRDADWDEESNPKWLTAEILHSLLTDGNHHSAEEKKSSDPEVPATTTSKVAPQQDVNATNALKSIISTMKFSTDFVSELD